jgi:protoheme IX farnesyltransferase
MKFRDDYAAASVPMLPVVAPAQVVARKILFYSYVMVATTLALAPYAGWIYTVCAAGLGAWFLAEAHRLHGQVSRAARPSGAAGATAPAVTATSIMPNEGPADPPAATADVAEGSCAGLARPGGHPAPMRLFHLSIAYLTLLFAAIAVVSLLPWGGW